MYASGEGVPQDYTQAVRWWRMAAEQRVQTRFVQKCTLIWIDPVKLPLRFSNAPPSMCWIHGAAGMIRDGGSL